MKKYLALIASCLGFFYLQSCYYDSEEVLYPSIANPCDTTNVTYSKNISGIINNYCKSCHGATYVNDGGSYKLDTYTDLNDNLDAVINAIKHTSKYPMPKNSAALNPCLIRQFEIWKNNGAPNN